MKKTTIGTLIFTITLTSGAQALPPPVRETLPPPVPVETNTEGAAQTQTETWSPFAFLANLFSGRSSSSPAPTVGPIVDEECDPSAPLQCREPVTAVCAHRKPENRIPQMEAAINRRFFPRQHRNQRDRFSAFVGASREAERQAYSQSPVTRGDIEGLFNNVRESMRGLIAENPSIPANQRQSMFDHLGAVRLFASGSEYMAAELAERRSANPQATEEQNLQITANAYEAACGKGLGINALNRGNKIHLCPGVIQSLIDRRASREEVMNALAFTLGNELSQSIGPRTFPQLYERMGECYNQLNNDPRYWSGTPQVQTDDAQGGQRFLDTGRGVETAADYWGTQILAKRIAEQGMTGDMAVRTIAVATDDLCNNVQSPQHAPGNDRIRLTIVRNPTIREAIGCGNQPARSSCSMSGVHR